MSEGKKSVATHLAAYYRAKGEEMPATLKRLIFNYNIQRIPYDEFGDDINLDGDKKDEEEVVKFILDPNNSYLLGKIGHSSLHYDTPRLEKLVIDGHVITEDKIKLMLK